MTPRRKSTFARLVDKINPEVLFGRTKRDVEPRTIYINQPIPDEYRDPKGKILKKHVFCTNQVLTSKYSVLTFVPRNLLEQFRRVANVFFAAIAILQFFPRFSTINPGLVLIPLIVVLLISALKDGYEDIKRHQSDRKVNNSLTHALEAPGWENHNPTGEKTRTFRTILAMIRRKKPEEAHPSVEQQEAVANKLDAKEDAIEGEKGTYRWKATIWEDLKVGDFVKLYNDEQLPADIVLCATSEEENVAYVETKNLDGETTLKSRNAVSSLAHLNNIQACADPEQATFTIEADKPDENMYRLNAKVIMNDRNVRPQPIDSQTVLLRGSVIRNTKWVIGIVMFTGEDTKVVLNSSGAPSKRSKVEKQMNPQVLINLAILMIMCVVCAIVESILDRQFHKDGALWAYGEDTSSDNPNIDGLATWANALITFQNVVPISLYISIEVVRSLQAAFIYFDSEIYYEKSDTATLARSWNLADDLGQIEYIFSDKTGTLTQNAMIFRQCSIGGKVYRGDPPAKEGRFSADSSSGVEETSSGETSGVTVQEKAKLPPGVLRHFQDSILKDDLDKSMHAESGSPSAGQARNLNGFFTVLSLCHTVIASPDPDSGVLSYKAQSPDEAALVQAAADVGFVFLGRDHEHVRLRTPFRDEVEEYELLNVLEFNSSRKRMSVIVRKLDDEDRRIFLLCKGADNVIFERLKTGDEDMRVTTEEYLEEFADEGLRTLCLAYKVVPEDQYEAWSHRYHEASTVIIDREKEVEKVSAEIENDLRLLGATAIEDRLQDGVPEAIASFKRAGIKVWVATGDKLETAIAIGYSTNLIGKDSNLIVVRGGRYSAQTQLQDAGDRFFRDPNDKRSRPSLGSNSRRSFESNRLRRTNTGVSSIVGEDNGSRPGGFVLVIDGSALHDALEDDTRDLLLDISTKCEAVICCRTSPLQKAQIVELVKYGLGAMTLAIGDGANDVSMIQSAHVGVGISGEEGLQAVNSSDYAIAQFRFLKRLLFVHGHWSYARNANMILNFFYKNIVCIGVLWWYQIYCEWSTQYVFDYTYLLFWNVFWSLATVIAIGIFDRFADDDMLMAFPELYRFGREGKRFTLKNFTLYMLDAVFQSAMIFFICTYSYILTTARTDGYDVSRVEYATTMVIATVMVVNLFNGLNTSAWTSWVFFAVLIGPVLVWLFTVVYSDISPGWFYVATFGNNHYLFRSVFYWFNIAILLVLCLLPRYISKAIRVLYNPNDVDILRAARKMNPKLDIWTHPLLSGKFRADKEGGSEKGDSSALYPPRPGFYARRSVAGSRTDMATGLQSVHRGFDFATEEGGVSMRRIQSNLSERYVAKKQNAEGGHRSPRLFPSLRRSMKKPRNP